MQIRNSQRVASFLAGTIAVVCGGHQASAQLQVAGPTVRSSAPGAMTVDGNFFALPLCWNLGVAEFDLGGQWSTEFVDRGAGRLLSGISAPAGPLPTGGVIFIDESLHTDALMRWDPGVGVTYMSTGGISMPHGLSDVACNDRVLLVAGSGDLLERDVTGGNTWTTLLGGLSLEGRPEVVRDQFSGVTYAAVTEWLGRLWIVEDVCGAATVHTPGNGQPGNNPNAYCTSVGAGMNNGKFFATAEYWNNTEIHLWEAGYDAQLNAWGWYNHGRPAWADDLVGTPVAVRDGMLLVLATYNATGRLVAASLEYQNGTWNWYRLHSPPGDDIEPGTLTAEFGANRAVVRGKSGKFWMLRDDGSGWFWHDLGTPKCP